MATAFEIVQENRKEVVNELITMMEDGYFFNNPEWDRLALRPHNPVTNAIYKGGNKIRLMQAAIVNKYDDPRWMTFKQISDKKYSLEKGSKGILCEKWIFDKIEKEIDPDTGKEKEIKVPLKTPQVRYFYVFNARYINGLPELEKIVFNDMETIKIAERVISSSECKIYEIAQDRAFYRPGEDSIYLPLRTSFKDETSFLKTALHEMSHSTGHQSRLNRGLFSGDKYSSNYSKEEIRAELGALFTEKDLGITLAAEHMEDHSDYLRNYIEMLSDDPNELFRACADSEKISELLVYNYEKQLEKELQHELGKDFKNLTEMEKINSIAVEMDGVLKTEVPNLYDRFIGNEPLKRNMNITRLENLMFNKDVFNEMNMLIKISNSDSIQNSKAFELAQKLKEYYEPDKEMLPEKNVIKIPAGEKTTFAFYECSEFHTLGKEVTNLNNIEKALTLYDKAVKNPVIAAMMPGISAIVDEIEYPLYAGKIYSLDYYAADIKNNSKILDALTKCENYSDSKANVLKGNLDVINRKAENVSEINENSQNGANKELGYIRIIKNEMELER